MTEVIVKARQTVFDIAIQEFGTLENLRDVILTNDINLNVFMPAGTILQIDSTGKGNEDVKDFYKINNIIPQNNWEELIFITCDSDLTTCDVDTDTVDQITL